MNGRFDENAAAALRVPMSGPDITDVEVESVVAVLNSGCLSLGNRLEEFERHVAAMTGATYAIGVSSGTAGLHLAVIAAEVAAGDIVITTPFSFVASANCVLYERAVPVFVDVDPVTGNIDPIQVEQAAADLQAGGVARERRLPRALRGSTACDGDLKAILPVHAFGQPADMDAITGTARAHHVPVIEDACEAIGARYKDRQAGAIGDVGVFAFYPNKQMTTGEGGIVVTNRGDWAAQCRSLRNQGRDAMDAWLRHERLGYNYRMNELSAALGVAQLSRLESLLAARDRVAAWYQRRLSAMPAVHVPRVVPNTTRMSWFTYVVRFDHEVDRDRVMSGLAERGIPSRPYFSPIHLQPFYMRQFCYRRGDFPIAEMLGDSCLALPFCSLTTEAQVDRVCDALRDLVATHRRAAPTYSLTT